MVLKRSAAALAALTALAALLFPAGPACAAATQPLFDGLGSYTHPISTQSKEAQRYFDQGMVLAFGFNHDEAIRSFEAAARLDSTNAMPWWGIAWAHGPNINLPMDSEAGKKAWTAIARAQALAARPGGANEREREYVDALARRYVAEPGAARGGLDSAYVDAMRALAGRHPEDDDAAVLFAEALMNLRPWDHWTHDGRPQPGTEELLATLERVLRRNPNHPGANHYYIHSVEASPDPGRALAAAERLPGLVPGAGHLVHMPAHIYQRVGRYDAAARANLDAARLDSLYIAKYDPAGVYRMMYYPHNIHFAWASLSMEGRSAEALAEARRVAGMAPAEMVLQMPMIEFVPPTPYYALARFGQWEAILGEPAPDPALRFTTGMWRYARGLAYAATARPAEARIESDSLEAIRDALPADLVVGLNNARALLGIAAEVLAGDMAARAGNHDAAIAAYRRAVVLEDDLRYDEPAPWYQPVREFLGAELLAARRPAEAEAAYREDLKRNPENGWALYGLAQALRAQGKSKDASAAEARYRKAWVRADVPLHASRF